MNPDRFCLLKGKFSITHGYFDGIFFGTLETFQNGILENVLSGAFQEFLPLHSKMNSFNKFFSQNQHHIDAK
jgi:hypothetical protein